MDAILRCQAHGPVRRQQVLRQQKKRRFVGQRAALCDTVRDAAPFYEEPRSSVSSRTLEKQQKQIVEDIRCCSKKMKKLAEKVEDACVETKSQLAQEMAAVLRDLQKHQGALEELVSQMRAAGYQCEDSSSSSSSEDECDVQQQVQRMTHSVGTDRPMSPVAVGAPTTTTMQNPLADLKAGTVMVCTGKACERRGGALLIADALTEHFAGTSVGVSCTKCMDMCKQATNLRVTGPAGDMVMLNKVTVEALAEMLPGLKVPALN